MQNYTPHVQLNLFFIAAHEMCGTPQTPREHQSFQAVTTLPRSAPQDGSAQIHLPNR